MKVNDVLILVQLFVKCTFIDKRYSVTINSESTGPVQRVS